MNRAVEPQVIEDFRRWLAALATPDPSTVPSEGSEPVDLHTLLGQFLALKQEIHLQTRATRTQQEQNAETLTRLQEAVEDLQDREARAREALDREREELARPFLKTLVDLYDALALATREVQRVQSSMAEEAAASRTRDVVAEPRQSPELPPPPAPTFWGRVVGMGAALAWQQQALTSLLRAPSPPIPNDALTGAHDRLRTVLNSVATGYNMSLERIDRALRQHGLEPMNCVGMIFDPEHMEVLEAVSESGRPSGEVLQEVRRGYFWNGRVFRFAQVRVAKGS